MQPDQELAPLGKYHLVATLGRGGMATVYLALVAGPGGFNKLLVVKVMKEEVLAGCEDGVDLFWDEARLSARLIHPNIVHTYEVGESDGRYFLAMEYLEGQAYRTVQHRTARNRLPLAEEIRILAETARGLHYAHELRDFDGRPMAVVHRDVSPQNVFLTYDGQVKLLDFGIAKTLDANHQTTVGVIKGKIDYIAPEQLRGDAVDARSDVFALGVMLWEAVAGQRFAGGRKVVEATKVHVRLSAGEPNIRGVKPEVPEPLAAIIDRALALEAEARFQDAASFADALEGYLESRGEKPSAKNLSALMTALFADDRRTVHKLIERQIQAMKRESVEFGQSGQLPRLGSPHTQSASGVWLDPSQVERAVLASERVAGAPDRAGSVPVARVTTLRRAGQLLAVALGALAAVTLVAAATIGVGVVLLPEPVEPAAVPAPIEPRAPAAHGPPRGAVVQAAPQPLAPARQPSAAANSVLLALTVTPAGAEVSIDGASVPASFSATVPRDGAMHQIEARAEGYLPYSRRVAFDQDRALEIVLEPAHSSETVADAEPNSP